MSIFPKKYIRIDINENYENLYRDDHAWYGKMWGRETEYGKQRPTTS